MRKITEQSVTAFLTGKELERQNMAVYQYPGYAVMLLHGNKIAEWNNGGLHVTLAGWPTVTTRERLDGLCQMIGSKYRIAQRNHKQVLLDALTLDVVREIDPHEWITISDMARKPQEA